jgi:hypothetical protein
VLVERLAILEREVEESRHLRARRCARSRGSSVGRVDAIEVDADNLLKHAARIEAAAPALRSLTITKLASEDDRVNDIKTGPDPLERFASSLSRMPATRSSTRSRSRPRARRSSGSRCAAVGTFAGIPGCSPSCQS